MKGIDGVAIHAILLRLSRSDMQEAALAKGRVPKGRVNVDKAWFASRMKEHNLTMRSMADRLNMHYSALSRTLNGERRMQVDEMRKIAEIFGRPESEILMHYDFPATEDAKPGAQGSDQTFGESAGGNARARLAQRDSPGFMEGQVDFKEDDMSGNKEEYIVPPRGADPLFGCMAGTLILLPDVDYTAPADPDWGRVYDD
ncbi:helix-turn-helix domain-containing protein [Mesorhizobium temperatum]|uniref:helix-turn-helix domain-containing protein n=1 Tax=Mesorhizobium temperatum TaxID=241416 RepID=UPI00142E40F6|nr:helix-turn-helix transcriptional regulator [Mesorhizobium temperatum]